MVELYGAVFIIGFSAAIAILLYKLYNVLYGCEKYEFPIAIITFIGYFLAWVVCFVVLMQDPEEVLYSSLLYLLNWCITLNTMLFIVEVFQNLKAISTDSTIRAYQSKMLDGKNYTPERAKM